MWGHVVGGEAPQLRQQGAVHLGGGSDKKQHNTLHQVNTALAFYREGLLVVYLLTFLALSPGQLEGERGGQ